eukprot:5027329-Prymnesium_polylepis.2
MFANGDLRGDMATRSVTHHPFLGAAHTKPLRDERACASGAPWTLRTHSVDTFWAKSEEICPIHSGCCIESHEEKCENHSHILGGWRSRFRINHMLGAPPDESLAHGPKCELLVE